SGGARSIPSVGKAFRTDRVLGQTRSVCPQNTRPAVWRHGQRLPAAAPTANPADAAATIGATPLPVHGTVRNGRRKFLSASPQAGAVRSANPVRHSRSDQRIPFSSLI